MTKCAVKLADGVVQHMHKRILSGNQGFFPQLLKGAECLCMAGQFSIAVIRTTWHRAEDAPVKKLVKICL